MLHFVYSSVEGLFVLDHKRVRVEARSFVTGSANIWAFVSKTKGFHKANLVKQNISLKVMCSSQLQFQSI